MAEGRKVTAYLTAYDSLYGCGLGVECDVMAQRERAWKDSNLRHTAPETVALSPELQARSEG